MAADDCTHRHDARLPYPDDPRVIERLESLDDVIFAAIEGDSAALEASAPAWREAVTELGAEAIAETRTQYLCCARNTWQFLARQTVQQPLRLLAVMKIIGMLTGDDS